MSPWIRYTVVVVYMCGMISMVDIPTLNESLVTLGSEATALFTTHQMSKFVQLPQTQIYS